jgi:NADH-quinone oxidoreductase subunit F
MAEGRLQEAYLRHMENNPFPIACSRVCPAFCEKKCSRGKYDQAIAIREVKRLFADWAVEQDIGFLPPKTPKKERVAIIGAGPAGLACGFYLSRMGYRPVVFEAMPVAGGMMKLGIPDFRLPKEKLAAEIAVIERAGVEIRLNSPVKSVEDLKNQGFQAVFLGTGAWTPQPLNVPGIDLKGVLSGIDFLREVNLGKKVEVGQRVVVIGGGSTAMDAARVSKRLGAQSVQVVYRRTRAEMPAWPEEIEEAQEERIQMDFLVNPVKVEGKNGKVTGLTCIRTELGEFDESGRRKPVPLRGSEFTIPVDTIILCLGQKLSGGLNGAKLKLDKRGQIEVNARTLATNLPGVFAGGDSVNPSTIIESVAQGRKAAVEIDRHFGYEGKLFARERQPVAVSYDEEAYLKNIPRKTPRLEEVEKRIHSLAQEVNLGLLREQAMEEARRCMHCDRNQPVVAAGEETDIGHAEAV